MAALESGALGCMLVLSPTRSFHNRSFMLEPLEEEPVTSSAGPDSPVGASGVGGEGPVDPSDVRSSACSDSERRGYSLDAANRRAAVLRVEYPADCAQAHCRVGSVPSTASFQPGQTANNDQGARQGVLQPLDAALLREFWSVKPPSPPPPCSGSSLLPANGDEALPMKAPAVRTSRSPFIHVTAPQPQQPHSAESPSDLSTAWAQCVHANACSSTSWGPAQLQPSRLCRSVSAQEFAVDAIERCVRAGVSRNHEGRVRGGRRTSNPLSMPRMSAGGLSARSSQHTDLQHCASSTLPAVGSETKLHGGSGCMDSRVRGGQLLRTHSKDVHASLDGIPATPSSAESLSGAASAHLTGAAVRLASLDSVAVSQLDRAVSSSMEQISSALPSEGGRMYKVRPMGMSASVGGAVLGSGSLSLAGSLNGTGTSGGMARADSSLFELAEEQVAMMAAMTSLAAGPFENTQLFWSHLPGSSQCTSLAVSPTPSNFSNLNWPSLSAPSGDKFSLAAHGMGVSPRNECNLMTISSREPFGALRANGANMASGLPNKARNSHAHGAA